MRIWLAPTGVAAGELIELARHAEAAGFEGLALSDHACVPAELATKYPYAGTGPAVLPTSTEFPDPLVAMAAIAACTTRLRVTTNVLVLPLRNPILLAKAVATAVVVGGNRIDLGIAVGWLREEFSAVGIDFDARGRRTDEVLDALRLLWTGEVVAFRGSYVTFQPLAVRPRPPTPIRILVGGHSAPALRRAAFRGDGWIGTNVDLEQLTSIVPTLRRLRHEAGRADEPFELRTGLRGRVTEERLVALADSGIDTLYVTPRQVLGPDTPTDVDATALGHALAAFIAGLGVGPQP